MQIRQGNVGEDNGLRKKEKVEIFRGKGIRRSREAVAVEGMYQEEKKKNS